MRKLIVIGGIAMVLAAGAGIWLLVTGLGSVVGYAIEKSGSEVTDTRVRVAGVDLKLREGHCTVEGIRVAGPGGFATPDVFVLRGIAVDLDVASVRADPIVIEEIRIAAPGIHAEFRKDGTSNIEEISRRVRAYAGNRTGGAPGGKKLRIDKVVFEGGSIGVDASALGVEARTVDLPAFTLERIGGDAGIPPDEVAQVVLDALTRKAAAEIAGGEIQRLLEPQLGGSVTDAVEGLLGGAGK
ncbi:hypothetical protein K8I85_00540 [bacterium]|nr:hypothetical protein [bacterium]